MWLRYYNARMFDPELAERMERERARRHRRNLALRTMEQRAELGCELQMRAYELMKSNPVAWQAFLRRNHAARAISWRDPT